MDEGGARDECAARGRRNRVVLMPRRWHQVLKKLTLLRDDGDKKARSPGRARNKPLKPLRRECRVNPVNRWLLARMLFTFAYEAAGASGARLSLRPLLLGRMVTAQLGRFASREGGFVFYRHRPRRRAIQHSRGSADENDGSRRTGYPACAGYDGSHLRPFAAAATDWQLRSWPIL